MSDYGTVSIGNLIAKVYRDLKPSQQNWEHDVIEWAGEALCAIGSFPIYEKSKALLYVSNNRTLVPKDFYKDLNVSYNPKFKLNFSSAIAEKFLKDRIASINMFELSATTMRKGTFDFPYGSNNDEAPKAMHHSYRIEGPYIKTSLNEDYIVLAYYKITTDDNGYPLIPNINSVKEAILWKVISKMLLSGYKLNNTNLTFDAAEQRWEKYCLQARGDLNEMDEKEYETFKNMWVRMIPDQHSDMYFSDTLSSNEKINRDGQNFHSLW